MVRKKDGLVATVMGEEQCALQTGKTCVQIPADPPRERITLVKRIAKKFMMAIDHASVLSRKQQMRTICLDAWTVPHAWVITSLTYGTVVTPMVEEQCALQTGPSCVQIPSDPPQERIMLVGIPRLNATKEEEEKKENARIKNYEV